MPGRRIVAAAVAGVPPRVMGLGPVHASRKALARAGLTLEQMDVIEINEAFAAQVLGCCQQLGIDGFDERLNPNGGAIAVGHPLGASGRAPDADRPARAGTAQWALCPGESVYWGGARDCSNHRAGEVNQGLFLNAHDSGNKL